MRRYSKKQEKMLLLDVKKKKIVAFNVILGFIEFSSIDVLVWRLGWVLHEVLYFCSMFRFYI